MRCREPGHLSAAARGKGAGGEGSSPDRAERPPEVAAQDTLESVQIRIAADPDVLDAHALKRDIVGVGAALLPSSGHLERLEQESLRLWSVCC